MKKQTGCVSIAAFGLALALTVVTPISATAAGFIKLGDIKAEAADSGATGQPQWRTAPVFSRIQMSEWRMLPVSCWMESR